MQIKIYFESNSEIEHQTYLGMALYFL